MILSYKITVDVKTTSKFCLGRPPFLFVNRSGDKTLTTEHLIRFLKKKGSRTLTLYRGHSSFDYFFYRLLLGDHRASSILRKKFANWLEENLIETSIARDVEQDWLRTIISLLRNKNTNIESILSEISSKLTTSVMFTSLTDKTSFTWAQQKENSEVLELRLDLEKIPDWYIEQIIYGADLEVEVAFPFATEGQRDALRGSLKIQRVLNSFLNNF